MEQQQPDPHFLVQPHPRAMMAQQPPNDWQILGETFEAMGKVGLAMTVGFSVAAAFCKLVDSGRVKVPKASQLLQMVAMDEAQEKGKSPT